MLADGPLMNSQGQLRTTDRERIGLTTLGPSIDEGSSKDIPKERLYQRINIIKQSVNQAGL